MTDAANNDQIKNIAKLGSVNLTSDQKYVNWRRMFITRILSENLSYAIH
jgi:hypothetical protein